MERVNFRLADSKSPWPTLHAVYTSFTAQFLPCILRQGGLNVAIKSHSRYGSEFKPVNLRRYGCQHVVDNLVTELTGRCFEFRGNAEFFGGFTYNDVAYDYFVYHGPGEQDSFGWLTGLTRVRIYKDGVLLCKVNVVWG